MFIAREKELKQIMDALALPGQHTLIYGNRRVGKTTLATKAARKSGLEFIAYECKKDSLAKNLAAFEQMLFDLNIMPFRARFESFTELFKYLDSLGRRLVILLDEYPYLYFDEKNEVVDSLFQVVLDTCSENLNFIISGSHIGLMKGITESANPLFGRFKAFINLREFNYLDASRFYDHLSPYDKGAFYAVFGGSPFVLEQLDFRKSIEENIKNTFLAPDSALSMFISELYTSDLPTKETANKIFEAIGNSNLRYNRIEELAGLEKNGLLSKHLKTLMRMNFIGANVPINKPGDSKKTTYFIKNNPLRFYYTYVYGKTFLLNILGPDEFYERYIAKSITTFVARRFEDIAKTFCSLLVQKGALTNVFNIGSYYYDDPEAKQNGEFDLAIQREGSVDIIEVKYLKNKVDKAVVNAEIGQIRRIRELRIGKVGFISVNGFEPDVEGLDYMFDGKQVWGIQTAPPV